MLHYIPVAENCADGMFHPVTEMAQLEILCKAGHKNSHKGKENQGGPSPDEPIDEAVYVGDHVNHKSTSFFCVIFFVERLRFPLEKSKAFPQKNKGVVTGNHSLVLLMKYTGLRKKNQEQFFPFLF